MAKKFAWFCVLVVNIKFRVVFVCNEQCYVLNHDNNSTTV